MPAFACNVCGRINAERTCAQHRPGKTRSPSSRRTGTRQWRAIRAMILNRDDHTCQLCGSEGTQVDHINAVASGGTDHASNLRAICFTCNQARNRRATGHVALVYGPPASGKSRIARALRADLGWVYVSIDDARAKTRTPALAWTRIAEQLDKLTGPLILEGCNPPPSIYRRLEQRGHTTIRADADRETIERRLTARGWKADHAERVSREEYDTRADFTIPTSRDRTLDLDLLVAYLTAAEAKTPPPAG